LWQGTVVFTEVKTRSEDGDFSPADNLSDAQRKRMQRVAEVYLKRFRLTSLPVRFDVVEVVFPAEGRKTPRVEHYPAAW